MEIEETEMEKVLDHYDHTHRNRRWNHHSISLQDGGAEVEDAEGRPIGEAWEPSVFSVLESKFLFGLGNKPIPNVDGGGGHEGGEIASAALEAKAGTSTSSSSSSSAYKTQRGKVCILSVDGGAGMSSILVGKALVHLEQALRDKSGDPEAHLSTFFDVAAGTGIGGIFIAMLFATANGSAPLYTAADTCRFLTDHGQLLFLPPSSSASRHSKAKRKNKTGKAPPPPTKPTTRKTTNPAPNNTIHPSAATTTSTDVAPPPKPPPPPPPPAEPTVPPPAALPPPPAAPAPAAVYGDNKTLRRRMKKEEKRMKKEEKRKKKKEKKEKKGGCCGEGKPDCHACPSGCCGGCKTKCHAYPTGCCKTPSGCCKTPSGCCPTCKPSCTGVFPRRLCGGDCCEGLHGCKLPKLKLPKLPRLTLPSCPSCKTLGCAFGGCRRKKPPSATAEVEEVLKDTFGAELTLRETLKPVLVPCYDLETSAPFLFSRADAVESASFNFRLWEVCRATWAEPGRLDPAEIRSVDGATRCVGVDGGLVMSNPTAAAITHVLHNKSEFPFVRGVEDLLVLSLGACGSSTSPAGATAPAKDGGRYSGHDWLKLRRRGRKKKRVKVNQEEWARPIVRIASHGTAELVDQAVGMAFHSCRSSSNYVRIQPASSKAMGGITFSATTTSGITCCSKNETKFKMTDADSDPSDRNVQGLLRSADEMLKNRNVESVLFGGMKRVGEHTNAEVLDWLAGRLLNEHQTRSSRIAPTVALKRILAPPTSPITTSENSSSASTSLGSKSSS